MRGVVFFYVLGLVYFDFLIREVVYWVLFILVCKFRMLCLGFGNFFREYICCLIV